jgi:hypothetical protein
MPNLKEVQNFISDFSFLIASGLVASLLLIVRKYIQTLFTNIIESLFKIKIYRTKIMSSASVHQSARIQDILAQLRIQANCDRAYILQFHNGSIFTSKNQMWKVSCTNESVDAVRPRIAELQNILSSAISDLLYPYWSNGSDCGAGILKLDKSDCSSCTNDDCTGGVFFHDVDKLQAGFSKGSLVSGDVKYAMRAAILDSDNNKIGILCLDYCWKDTDINQIKSMHEPVCRASNVISYELSNRK